MIIIIQATQSNNKPPKSTQSPKFFIKILRPYVYNILGPTLVLTYWVLHLIKCPEQNKNGCRDIYQELSRSPHGKKCFEAKWRKKKLNMACTCMFPRAVIFKELYSVNKENLVNTSCLDQFRPNSTKAYGVN